MPSPTPPTAERRPHVREHHGDRVEDPYAWMRDLEDPALLAHLEAENAYAEARTEHLAPLRTRDRRGDPLAGQGDRPVGARRERPVVVLRAHRRGPAVRRPGAARRSTDPAVRPDPEADAVPGEQVVVDGNVEAGDSEFFSLGALTVSADHRLVAFAVDTAGDERFALTDPRDRHRRGARHLDHRHRLRRRAEPRRAVRVLHPARRRVAAVPAVAAPGRWRPGRRRAGAPGGRRALLDGRVRAAATSAGSCSGWGRRRPPRCTSSTPTTREGQWRVLAPRREGVEYDVEPAADRFLDRAQHRHARRRPRVGAVRRDEPRAVGAVARARARASGSSAVDAFDDATVLSLRTGGLTALRVLPRDPASRSGHGEPWDVEVDQAVHSIGLGDNPEPGQTRHPGRRRVVGHPAHRARRRPRDPRAHAAQAPAGAGRLRRRELHRAPGVGHGIRRHARAGLGGAPRRRRARRHQPRCGHGLRRRTRSRRTRTSRSPGSACSTAGSSTPWRTCAAAARWGGAGTTTASCSRRPTRSPTPLAARRPPRRRPGWVAPDRVGLEGGSAGGLLVGAVLNLAPGAVPRGARRRAVRRRAHDDAPARPAADRGGVGGVGQPARRPRGVCRDARLRAVRERPRGRLPGGARDVEPARHPGLRHRARQVGRAAARDGRPATRGSRPVLLRTELAAGHGGRSGRYAAWEQIAWEWAFVLDQLGATERL